MNRFSIGQAWSHAASFFSGNGALHAIVLIGIGVIIPVGAQWAIIGNPMANAFSPTMMSNPTALAGVGVSLLVISLLSYVLQFGSYFTSWRLGFGGSGGDLVGGLRFGMLDGAALLALLVATLIVASLLAVAISPWLAAPAVFIMLLFMVIIYPALFGFIAIIALIFAAIGSFALSSIPMMAMGAAGGGMGLILMLAIATAMLWLAARLCCTAPSMADRQEFLPFAAMKRSWAMTSAGQWRIVGYFLLIGIVLLIGGMIVGLIVGSSLQSLIAGGSSSIATLLLITLLVSIPAAYFIVAIPAGVYRALGQDDVSEVFA